MIRFVDLEPPIIFIPLRHLSDIPIMWEPRQVRDLLEKEMDSKHRNLSDGALCVLVPTTTPTPTPTTTPTPTPCFFVLKVQEEKGNKIIILIQKHNAVTFWHSQRFARRYLGSPRIAHYKK